MFFHFSKPPSQIKDNWGQVESCIKLIKWARALYALFQATWKARLDFYTYILSYTLTEKIVIRRKLKKNNSVCVMRSVIQHEKVRWKRYVQSSRINMYTRLISRFHWPVYAAVSDRARLSCRCATSRFSSVPEAALSSSPSKNTKYIFDGSRPQPRQSAQSRSSQTAEWYSVSGQFSK